MKFYTIQKFKAWQEAQSKGYLTGNKDYIDDEWFLNPYTWMMKQMSKRLPEYKGEYPVWLWLSTDNISFSELLEDDYVLLEVELPQDQVLLSNFDAWHIVLNDSHFDEDNIAITKEKSWEYIFDKDKLEWLGYDFEKEDLQGVIERINCNDIKVLKYIVSDLNRLD